MSEGEQATTARFRLRQGIIVVVIAAFCGALGSCFQFAAKQPLSAAEVDAKLAKTQAAIEAEIGAKLPETPAATAAEIDDKLAKTQAAIAADIDAKLAETQAATAAKVGATFDRRLPIGTIVASVIAPDEFVRLVGAPETFEPKESIWVPADGREVPESAYAALFLGTTEASDLSSRDPITVPDLRGLFLRGLNAFEESKERTDGKQDQDGAGRTAGHYQSDETKAHSHGIDPAPHYGFYIHWRSFQGEGNENSPERTVKMSDKIPWRKGSVPAPEVKGTKPFGGKETRPKNVAVYYYIKIN